jgi:hypothetical protein
MRVGTPPLSWISRILLLLVAAAAIAPILLTPLTPDVASTLAVSHRLLEGGRLYRDVVEYAPPLIFLLGMPIEAVSSATGWPEWPLVAGVGIGLTIIALALSRRLLQPERLTVTVLVGALVMLLVSPARDFGQAEHLAMILLLPYVLLCARLADGDDGAEPSRGIRAAIGLLACACVALKPIFLIVYAALAAYVAWSRRSVRPLRAVEHRVMAVGIVAYVLAILVFTPDYVRRVLPMAYLQHWTYGDPILLMVDDWMVVSVAASSLALAVFGPWLARGRPWATFVRACALTSLAMLVVFIAQGEQTPIAFLPVRAFNFLAAWLAVAAFVSNRAQIPVTGDVAATTRLALAFAARTGFVTLALVPPLLVWSMVIEVQWVDYLNLRAGLRSPYVEPLLDVVHQRAAGKPIFVLSSSTGPAFPLVNLAEATWPYRFKSLLFVSIYYKDIDNPATAVYRPPQAQSAGERAFFDDVVSELTRTPPALLIVDVTRLKRGFGMTYFDYLAYYRQSPAFGALLQHYRLIAWKKNFQVFEYQPSI